jgi:hypothetical protein
MRRMLSWEAREHAGSRHYVLARLDRRVLGRDPNIPHASPQRGAFAHSPASGELKAAVDDADAGRGDPDRRLQLFRHVGRALRRRSLGILPNDSDLRIK